MYKERTEQSFFSKVYFNMMWALALTGLVAYGVSAYPPFINAIINNVTGLIILMLLEVVLVAVLSRRIMAMSIGAAYVGLMVFSIINGVTLALIFLVYTTTSIVTVFAAAAGLFLVMAVFGYTTKRDLSAWGRFSYYGRIRSYHRVGFKPPAAQRDADVRVQFCRRIHFFGPHGVRHTVS